ncbi:class I SAM-dependent methyltransferase [Bacteriovoracaceae bacterium]|nr:class I SAM-dependent methyltransferase [Bacteriovoracaceae bacterium]
MTINPNELTEKTIAHYESDPEGFHFGTIDHDVSQNYSAFLESMSNQGPYNILDLGCGPGRDLKHFKKLGHIPVGLDGCESFCKMAREYSGCEVLFQDFIDLDLNKSSYDGIFANASLFHVPKVLLTEVVKKLNHSLRKDGILFSSNPKGNCEEMMGTRYGNFMQLESYKSQIESCGFSLIRHYYRPPGLPIEESPWLACVFRKL